MTSHEGRVSRLAGQLADRGFRAAVVTSWPDLTYLTGLAPLGAQKNSWAPFPLVVSQSGDVVLVCSYVYSRMIKDAYPGLQCVPFSEDALIYPNRSMSEATRNALQIMGMGDERLRLGVSYRHISAAALASLTDALGGAEFGDIAPLMEKLRYRKDNEELEYLREAGRLTNAIAEEVIHRHMRLGMTERDVAAALTRCAVDRGVSLAFVQVFAGRRSCYGNLTPGDVKIGRGDTVLLDFGVKTPTGYCSDITRAVVLGKPSPAQEQISKAVGEILRRTLEHTRPGMKASEVDGFARAQFSDLGYADQYIARTGHNVGLEPSEPFVLSEENEHDVLEPGMCLAIEPGIYINGVGIRLEDNVIVGANAIENLTTLPYDIIQA